MSSVVGISIGDVCFSNAETKAIQALNPCASCHVNLACACGPLAVAPNPLPWACNTTTADTLGSSSFQGLYVMNVTGLDTPSYARDHADAVCSGGSWSQARNPMREVVIEALLLAQNCAGADWGKRYVNKLLTAPCAGGGCPDFMQFDYCCDDVTTTWALPNAALAEPPVWESVCGCEVWKVTFTLFADADIVSCDTTECTITPTQCTGAEPCVPVDVWASQYGDLCGPCQEPDDDVAASDCTFEFKSPSDETSCSDCVSVDMGAWGPCCVINASADDQAVQVSILSGTARANDVQVGVFRSCPTSDACDEIVALLTVPTIAADKDVIHDGLAGRTRKNLGGRQVPAGATVEGSFVLNCGSQFYVAMRAECGSMAPNLRAIIKTRPIRSSLG